MEPITRSVYLAILSMLGVDPNKTREVRLERGAISIEEYTYPIVLDDQKEAVTRTLVVPIVNNGYGD